MRRQLSLFVPPPAAEPIEAVRRVVDPVQHALIPAHVTLLRDEEVGGVDAGALAGMLAGAVPITLTFGAAVRSGGHGLLLPVEKGVPAFRALRARLVGAARADALSPHLTLAHPRNPMAPGNDLGRARTLPVPLTVGFDAAQLIEQAPNAPWVVVAQYGFRDDAR